MTKSVNCQLGAETMKETVMTLTTNLTNLKVEERQMLKRLYDNRQEQTTILGKLQVKPKAPPTTRRVPRAAKPGAPASATAPAVSAKSGAVRVREYVIDAPNDAVITTGAVALKLALPRPVVSTVLSRLIGRLIERVPGTKRGKFRKIKRAA
jgi:hypothetical protein